MQNFFVVFSMHYEKCAKFLKKSWKIGLTFDVVSCKIAVTPTRWSPKGQVARMSKARQSRARQFLIYGLSVAPRLSWEARYRIQPSGWGAGEAKEREEKGRDACRGLRRDEVSRSFGARLHGTDESSDSLVQQFLKYIMESLILAQNERWRRG